MSKINKFRRRRKFTHDRGTPVSKQRKGPSALTVIAAGLAIGGGLGGAILYYPTIAIQRPSKPGSESYRAPFGFCHTGGGTNCVVDGDTFWFNGEKVRVSDIDAPETHPSHCPLEADLGGRATARLQALLNEGPFELEAGMRDGDRHGRKLRVVTREGRSLGQILVEEGLARDWAGSRRPWC
jgi:endonuclease YncB( thermonuclease family)